ncbi:hypothetical protein [Corynebacterium mastitidis]|uniref:hypothetical protein n=1 Tax=Corynebacterium mastitidis TaxID=161890 RepID=UPI00035E3A24|nr:hypothetical protein [Corynebacterium mastitidis]
MTTSDSELTALAEVVGVLEPEHYDGREEWAVGMLMALFVYGLTVMAAAEVALP